MAVSKYTVLAELLAEDPDNPFSVAFLREMSVSPKYMEFVEGSMKAGEADLARKILNARND